MTGPVKPADLWEHLVRAGISKADATRHVLRVVGNTPEQVRADYLKDIDPGKLASFGLGAADMASFGLGDQAARAIWGQEATDTQQAAETQHPTAHLAGEIAGIVSPLALERGLAAAGVKVAPTAIGTAVRGIQSTVGRAAAKTVLNAATGAGYAGAQAAGRTEGGLAPRLAAAQQAAVPGAVVGTILPLGLATMGAAGSKVLGPILKRVAGAGPAVAEATPGLLTPKAITALEARIGRPLGGPLEDITAAAQDLKAGKISQADFDTAMEMAGRPVRAQQLPIRGTVAASAPAVSQEPLLPALRAAADPRETVPAFVRNAPPGSPGEGLLPYYPRGGAAEQAQPAFPTVSPVPTNGLPLAQLKLLLHMPPAQFEAAAAMFPPEVMQQLRALRGGLLQPALP